MGLLLRFPVKLVHRKAGFCLTFVFDGAREVSKAATHRERRASKFQKISQLIGRLVSSSTSFVVVEGSRLVQ